MREHDRRATALATNELGDRVNFIGREGDDSRAARQSRQLLLAGKAELREPRAAHDAGAGKEPLHDRPHRSGAEHQGFLAPAPVQHAVGEDVSALEIGSELDFVDGEERNVEVARHGLDGGDPEARVRRLDLLLAGDERHRVGADPLDRAVVNFACQEPQWQADHA